MADTPQLEPDEDCEPENCSLASYDFCALSQTQTFCIAQRLAAHAAGLEIIASAMPLVSADDDNILTVGEDGGVYYSGGSPSDSRLKSDVTVIEGALDKVDAIRGVTFNWDVDAYYNGILPENPERQAGVIAQEIQAVLPEAVREMPDGFLAVDYNKIIPLLIEAIKELRAEIEDIKDQI